jgi:hypothetical protein
MRDRLFHLAVHPLKKLIFLYSIIGMINQKLNGMIKQGGLCWPLSLYPPCCPLKKDCHHIHQYAFSKYKDRELFQLSGSPLTMYSFWSVINPTPIFFFRHSFSTSEQTFYKTLLISKGSVVRVFGSDSSLRPIRIFSSLSTCSVMIVSFST